MNKFKDKLVAYTSQQLRVCEKYHTEFLASLPTMKLGASLNVKEGLFPINGMRHLIERDTSGWYILAGEVFSESADFFVQLHIAHLPEWSEIVMKYLGLPPGWRFLIVPGYEDVWWDESLLAV